MLHKGSAAVGMNRVATTLRYYIEGTSEWLGTLLSVAKVILMYILGPTTVGRPFSLKRF